MVIRIPRIAAALALGAAIALVPQQASANGCDPTTFAGGVGSVADPFQISTPAQLRAASVANCWQYSFALTADVDLTGTGDFTPIGDVNNPFGGTWDGRSHSITGLQVTAPTANGVGLFGTTNGATIRNLSLSGTVTADGYTTVGLLAGDAKNSTLENVRVAGAVRGDGGVGGLAGILSDTVATDVTVNATVTGENTVGGVAAFLATTPGRGAAITRARVDGMVTSTNGTAAGIAGSVELASISTSSSGAAVTGWIAGGIVGQGVGGVEQALVRDSYATGAIAGISGARAIGGIVALSNARDPVVVINTYFTGTLTPNGAGATGGIVGETGSFPRSLTPRATGGSSVWNSDITGTAGDGGSGGVGRTTAQMKDLATYSALGWSIVHGWDPAGASTWGICPQVNDGYPFLQYTGQRSACRAPNPAPAAAPATIAATVLPSRRRMVSGQSLRVGVRVANTGGTAAEGVVACVRLPSHMVLVRTTGARRSGRTACFTVGRVAAGAKATRVVTARAVSARRTTVTVQGSARATGLARVTAVPVKVVVSPRVARARVTG